MKILVPGVEPKEELITRTFQCEKCGCIFEADSNEYYYYEIPKLMTSPRIVEYYCNCPHNGCVGVGYELTDDNMLKAMILQRDKVNKDKSGE